MAKVRIYEFIDPIPICDANVPAFNAKYAVLVEVSKRFGNERVFKATFFRDIGFFKHTFPMFHESILVKCFRGFNYKIVDSFDALPEGLIDLVREELLLENNILDILSSDIWEKETVIKKLQKL